MQKGNDVLLKELHRLFVRELIIPRKDELM